MNIGIFTDTYYPHINGVVTSIMMLKREIEKAGHNVYIITTTDPQAKTSGDGIFRMPSMPFVFLPSHRFAVLYPPNVLRKIYKLKLDVIHTQTEFPMGIFGKVVSQVLRIPQVHTYHTMYEDYVHYILGGKILGPNAARTFSKFFCQGAKVVIAPVDKTKESLIDYGVIRPIRVIPTGIDFKPFMRENFSRDEILEIKNQYGVDENDPTIVVVARIAKEKNITAIIKQMPLIIKQIPDVKLFIVGDGPILQDLRIHVQALGLQDSIIFTGSKPWAEIGKYYQLGDLFISASTSETQGLTYIEAIAASVPVLAKKDRSVEGVIIEGETGFYFEKDDEIADAVVRILLDKELLETVAEKAINSIKHLSAERFGKLLLELYQDVSDAYPKNKKPLRKGLNIRRRTISVKKNDKYKN